MAGRKRLESATQHGPDFVGATPTDLALQEVMVKDASSAITKLADSLGYQGALDADALWSMVEFRQRRSVEDILAMGRGLLLIKEQSAHGAFQEQCEARGIQRRTAQRFMSVALKFSKSDTLTLLKAAGTQAKVLELTVLDDEDLAALDSGESVSGLTLDDVERMGASELRRALRDARADAQAKDERIAARDQTVNKLQDDVAKARRQWKTATPDEQRLKLERAVSDAAFAVRAAINAAGTEGGLQGAVVALGEHAAQHGQDVRLFLGNVFGELLTTLRVARDFDQLAVEIPIVNDGAEG